MVCARNEEKVFLEMFFFKFHSLQQNKMRDYSHKNYSYLSLLVISKQNAREATYRKLLWKVIYAEIFNTSVSFVAH